MLYFLGFLNIALVIELVNYMIFYKAERTPLIQMRIKDVPAFTKIGDFIKFFFFQFISVKSYCFS